MKEREDLDSFERHDREGSPKMRDREREFERKRRERRRERKRSPKRRAERSPRWGTRDQV